MRGPGAAARALSNMGKKRLRTVVRIGWGWEADKVCFAA